MAGQTELTLFGREPGDARVAACFARQYTPGHLATHPQQNVTAMHLLVDSTVDEEGTRGYALSIGTLFRGVQDQLQLAGYCGSSLEGKTLLSCGIECDGGQIDVRLRDAKSILVEIPFGARTWDPDSAVVMPATAEFGEDDKLFRLDRVDINECLPLVYDEDLKAQIAAGE